MIAHVTQDSQQVPARLRHSSAWLWLARPVSACGEATMEINSVNIDAVDMALLLRKYFNGFNQPNQQRNMIPHNDFVSIRSPLHF